MVKIIKSQKGVSLIEALVTIAVIGVLGLGLSNLISRTYKGGAKTELISDVKQNAQSSMDKITRIIREADSIVCPKTNAEDPTHQTLVIRNRDGKITRFHIIAQTASSNGYVLKQDYTQALDPNKTNYCDYTAFPANTNPSPEILTDNSSSSTVSVKSGSFTRSQIAGSKDTITIKLNVGPAVNSSGSYEQRLGSSDNSFSFETTVQLR